MNLKFFAKNLKYSMIDKYYVVCDICSRIFLMPFKNSEYNRARNTGKIFALPKRFFKKTLSDKQIAELGVPYAYLKNGNTIYKKSFSYIFRGKERCSNRFVNLTADKLIKKEVIQTKGITAEMITPEIPAYGSFHVFDGTGKLTSSSWHFSFFQNNEHKHKSSIFNITGSDNLILRTDKFFNFCKRSENIKVSLNKSDNIESFREFAGSKMYADTKAYIEKKRQDFNSPKSMKFVRSNIQPKDSVIRL